MTSVPALYSGERYVVALTLAACLATDRSASAQSIVGEGSVCASRSEATRTTEYPTRVMYATLEAPKDSSRSLAIYLGTLLQEVALAYVAPDSAPAVMTYSFTLRLHRDGRLTDVQPADKNVPATLAAAAIRAIDSVSNRGGIGVVDVAIEEDPLPLRLVFQLTKPKRDTSIPFYKMQYPAYFEFEVEKPVLNLSGNPAPEYPIALREQNIQGEVLVQFIVDTMGRADMRTFRLIGPQRVWREFAESVIRVLPKMRFRPAERSGCKVRQLVQLPFAFKLNL